MKLIKIQQGYISTESVEMIGDVQAGKVYGSFFIQSKNRKYWQRFECVEKAAEHHANLIKCFNILSYGNGEHLQMNHLPGTFTEVENSPSQE